MEVAELIDELSAQGTLLADAAARAGFDADVPRCPEWNVRDLVKHIGGIHRWAAANVLRGRPENAEDAGDAVGTGPGDDELLDWFRVGHAELVVALRAAPPDLQAFTFLPAPNALAFWARRQAHETAIHRSDAEAAAGDMAVFDAAFAQDGIAEVLLGFAARRSNAISTPATLALRASDGPAWRVVFGGERNVASTGDGAADAVVSGSSSAIYLWLWNRPSEAVVSGDVACADQWRTIRVRWVS